MTLAGCAAGRFLRHAFASGVRLGRTGVRSAPRRACAGCSGGSGEIRTHGCRETSPVFKTGAFNRSATLPGEPSILASGPISTMPQSDRAAGRDCAWAVCRCGAARCGSKRKPQDHPTPPSSTATKEMNHAYRIPDPDAPSAGASPSQPTGRNADRRPASAPGSAAAGAGSASGPIDRRKKARAVRGQEGHHETGAGDAASVSRR